MEGFPNFPDNVQIEILSRLSAKDLCTCRCVSKTWFHLIALPFFQKLHFNRSKRNPRLLFLSDSTDPCCNLSMASLSDDGSVILDTFSSHITDRISRRYISGCDLVCVIDGDAVYVSNPSTHEVAKLPDFKYTSLPDFRYPSFKTAGVGLGYVEATSEYKIIRFYFLPHRVFIYQVGVEIFTLQEGRPDSGFWRELPNCSPIDLAWIESVLLLNGSLYWLLVTELYGSHKILSFDLEHEEFANVCCPEGFPCMDDGDRADLIEVKGVLCLSHYLHKDSVINLWMLIKDHETQLWVKEFVIDLHGMWGSCMVLGYVPLDDHFGGISIWSIEQSSLLFYDIDSKSFTRVSKLTNIPGNTLQGLYFDTMFSLRNT
ncbi:hypothetical protein Vadar_020286 [Vaccinium darrowii]|uniref:Uncharacterized protein n=1 Tax=Vaccinium darrowii TaxID=229202 RepID=A0ACB7X2P0_9ERIC|nr:hypothetical protein Vadar_020286 [Vaccinium darrowii]